MKHSKETLNFARTLISDYSKFDRLSDCYNISLSNIPEFDLNEFSSYILKDNSMFASEATGPDNPSYEEKMLPALLKYLQDTTDKQNIYDFNRSWQEGITDYCRNVMSKILYDLLDDYNDESGYVLEHNNNYREHATL